MLVIFCLHLVVTETGLLSPNMNMHLSVFLFNPCSLSLLFRVIMFFWWWSILYLETLLVSTSTLTFLQLHCFSYGYLYRYLFSCLLLSTFLLIGEGNGNPLQNSYLENSWTEEPGRLQSMGSQRVGHDWVTSLSFPFLSFPFLSYLPYIQSTSGILPGRMKHKLESRLLGEIITSDMQMTSPLWQKAKGTKEPTDEGERG